MSIKQPPNLNPLGASVQTDATSPRAAKQPGQRPAPLQDDTAKDLKGKTREGHSKAFHDTFGAGSYDANVGEGNSYAGDMTISVPTYGGDSADYYEEKQDEVRAVESAFRTADIASGGDGNPYTLDSHYDDYYYDSYDYQPLQYNVAYDEYGEPYTTLDLTDPNTREAVENSHIVYEEDGTTPSYLLTDNTCARLGGKTADMYLEAKATLDKVTIDPATGLAMTSDMCVNQEATDRILLGQNDLNGEAAPLQSRAPDAMFAKTDILGPKQSPEQNQQFQRHMATSQGNDLFFATNAMAGKYDVLNKPTALSVSSQPSSDLLADADTPAPTPAAQKPVAAPALAV